MSDHKDRAFGSGNPPEPYDEDALLRDLGRLTRARTDGSGSEMTAAPPAASAEFRARLVRDLARLRREAPPTPGAFPATDDEDVAETDEAEDPDTTTDETSDDSAGDEASPATNEGRLLPFPGAGRRRRSSRLIWATAAAAAALVCITVLRVAPALFAPPGDLAPFQMSAMGPAEQRGTTEPGSGPPPFVENGYYRIDLRPDTHLDGDFKARAWMVDSRGSWTVWDAPFEAEPGGVIASRGSLSDDLYLEPGDWTLVVAISPRGDLPDTAAAKRRFQGGGAGFGTLEKGWLLSQDVRVVPSPMAPGSTATAEPTGPSLEVQLSGCASVRGTEALPICRLYPSEGRLRLWVRSARNARLSWRLEAESWVEIEKGRTERDALIRFMEPSSATQADPGATLLDFSALDGASTLQIRASNSLGETVRNVILEPESLRLHTLLGEVEALANPPFDAARQLLESAIQSEDFPEDGGTLRSYLAMVEILAGRPDQARRHFAEAEALHRAQGDTLRAVNDLTRLHGNLHWAGEISAARDALARLPTPLPADTDSAFQIAFYRGRWALSLGDTRSAARHLEDALEESKRAGHLKWGSDAAQLLARLERQLGRDQRAKELWSDLLDSLLGDYGHEIFKACNRGRAINNFAWDQLQILDSRPPGASDPTLLPGIDEALQAAQDWLDECTDDPQRALEATINLELNFALAELHAGRNEQARSHLAQTQVLLRGYETSSASQGDRLRAWTLDLTARVELAEGHPANALMLYDELDTIPALELWPELLWRAAIGRAFAHRANHETERALAAFERAERLLDIETLRAPIVGGRETSVMARAWPTHHHLDLLLEAGRSADAFHLVRRVRARLFHSLLLTARRDELSPEDRRNWERAVERYQERRNELGKMRPRRAVPRDEEAHWEAQLEARRRELHRLLDEAMLPLGGPTMAGLGVGLGMPAIDGEVVLLYHGLPDGGWVGFAASGTEPPHTERLHFEQGTLRLPAEATSQRTPSELEILSESLLAPFQTQILGARRVRVLASGALRDIDFHALPFGPSQSPLTTQRPVAYGLDIPPGKAVPKTHAKALLVPAPTVDLPWAKVETMEVGQHLTAEGWSVRHLEPDAATVPALRDLLPRSDLFHFAGHAEFAGHADFTGHSLDSALRLGERPEAWLTAADILLLGGVPASVILSACQSATTSRGDAPVEIGLAHAFLLAGSQIALGATRAVDDATTLSLMRHLYADWDGTPSNAIPALANAQTALRAEDPNADWAAFRVLTP